MVDESGYWRMDPKVPLVVPEVNPDEIHKAEIGIIASPNCSTTKWWWPSSRCTMLPA